MYKFTDAQLTDLLDRTVELYHEHLTRRNQDKHWARYEAVTQTIRVLQDKQLTPEHGQLDQVTIRDQVGVAAQALATLPIEWWPRWIAFFLECLEAWIGDRADGFDQVLAQVAKDIETRQTEGRW